MSRKCGSYLPLLDRNTGEEKHVNIKGKMLDNKIVTNHYSDAEIQEGQVKLTKATVQYANFISITSHALTYLFVPLFISTLTSVAGLR